MRVRQKSFSVRPKRQQQFHREDFDNLAAKLGIRTQEQWYHVDYAAVRSFYQSKRSKVFCEDLQRVYPEFQWHNWKFENLRSSTWSASNSKKYFDWLAEELGIHTFDEWKLVGHKDFREHGGRMLLLKLGNSIPKALATVYPQFEVSLSKASYGMWTQASSHRKYFDWYAEQHGIQKQEEWWNTSVKDVMYKGGSTILSVHGNSLTKALRSVYPEFEWHLWNFTRSPKRFWASLKNQRQYVDWLAEQLGIEQQEEWYQTVREDFTRMGGARVLELYSKSHKKLLSVLYPEFDWHFWRFVQVSTVQWEDVDNVKKFLDWLAYELNIESQQDWYEVMMDIDLGDLGMSSLLSIHGKSLPTVLKLAYPYFDWHVWNFASNQQTRQFFDWLAENLGIETQEDWYSLSRNQIIEAGGSALMSKHDSVISALSAAYSEFEWYEWKAASVNAGFWSHPKNQRAFLDDVAAELGIEYQEDWYDVTRTQICQFADGLILQYGSFTKAISSVYDEYIWYGWMFSQVHSGYWNQPENQRQFLDWLKEQLDISSMNDWYNILMPQIVEYGGEGLLNTYGRDLMTAITTVYPELPWQRWKFKVLPDGYWLNLNNVNEYWKWLEETLNIQKPEDWYAVTYASLLNHGAGSLLASFGGLLALLKHFYPQQDWVHVSVFAQRPDFLESTKAQTSLLRALTTVF